MTQATIKITNKLPTDTGFAIRVDDSSFAQVFVPSHLMRQAALEVNGSYSVVLSNNDAKLAAATPWRVSQMVVTDQPEPEVAVAPAPVEAPAPTSRSVDDDILEELDDYGWASTGEVAKYVGVEVGVARDRLLALFNSGKIVSATYSPPKGLPMALWARTVDSFGGLGGE